MVYNVVYLLILLFWGFSTLRGTDKRKSFLQACFLMLGLLSAFRFQNESSDFSVNYIRVIQAYSMSWTEVLNYSSEWLHQVIRKLIALIFRDPQWYFILTSLFIVGSYMKFAYKHVHNVYVYVILYYAVFSYFSGHNITRQALAVSIALWSWDAMLNKQLGRYLMIMLAATFIHTSAVFFIPLYFLADIKVNRQNVLLYLCGAAVIIVLYRPIMLIMQRFLYQNYIGKAYGLEASNSLRLVLAVIAVGAVILFTSNTANIEKREGIVEKETYYQFRQQNIICHGTIFYTICTVISCVGVLLFSRVAMWYAPCLLLCIDKALASLNQKNRRVLVFFAFIFATAWFVIMNATGSLIPTPYTPFWNFPDRMKI